MTDLLSPGSARAGSLMTDRALVAAVVRVEAAWYEVLAAAGIAPPVDLPTEAELANLSDEEFTQLSDAAEAGGNVIIPLLARLRAQLDDSAPEAVRWLHKGLTSQDALDTALMLLVRDVLDAIAADLSAQIATLTALARTHRDTLTAGRTLTQHAVPTTFGLIAASWLDGLLDVAEEIAAVRAGLPVQVGGAAGTLAAIAELAGPSTGSGSGGAGFADTCPELVQGQRGTGFADMRPELVEGQRGARAIELAADLAARLGLRPATPWHSSRRTITKIGDVLVAACDAWGRIANDVLVRARPECGELSEGGGPGRGGSSTMPHKQNPVLSVLIRRTALNAPLHGAALHVAAAAAVDQRSDGGWHAEWAPLRDLARNATVAAAQASELLAGLVVHADRMHATAVGAADDLLAEARSIRGLTATTQPITDPADYLGAARELIDATLRRAESLEPGRS